MLTFKELDAETALNSQFVDSYKKEIALFYSELVSLNANLYILKEIQNFPFNLLCKSGDKIFFSIVQQNLYENCIITITRIFTDKGSDILTIPKLKNNIIKNIKSEYIIKFIEHLKLLKFDKTTNDLLEKIHSIRNSRIAHLKGDTIINGQIESLNLSEIENIVDKFNNLLQALSFNVERIYLPLHYTEHNKQTTDIEKMLLSLAQNSNIVKMPEQSSLMWKRYKQTNPEEIVTKINYYREKLGLPIA